MKNFLIIIVFGLLGCRRTTAEEKMKVQMTSFKVLNEKEFEMCFDNYIPGHYILTIVTKSGYEIEREGWFQKPIKGQNEVCFIEKKTKFSLRSYSQKRFYYDSIAEGNIASIRWLIPRSKKISFSGEFKMK